MSSQTYMVPSEKSARPSTEPSAGVSRVSAPPIFSDSFWKRFQQGVESFPLPVICLSRDGYIQEISHTARRVLGYRTEDTIDRYFFTHVHGYNLPRVMRDLAHMVNAHTRHTSWLLRLQTKQRRCQWFRVDAVNRLKSPEQCIVLRLRSV